MKKKLQKGSKIFKFPQLKVFIFLLLMALVMIIVSINLQNPFWSSFCSNVSAGLFTGLVICLVSGFKSAYLSKLEQERSWLAKIHEMIMEYMSMWNKYISNDYDKDDEYNYVYDLCAHANWVNEFIIQSQFDKNNYFNGFEMCKDDFRYDATERLEEFVPLKEKIMEDSWTKREVIRWIEPVDKNLRSLNHFVVQKIEDIERDIVACNKSVI